jgi:hypothetical protein
VRAPIQFRWAPVKSASYYNLQLYRETGRGPQAVAKAKKVLTVWPKVASYTLTASWKFNGKTMRLAPGRYRWYVWPGFGKRADTRYGQLLGQSTFVVPGK